MAVEQLDQDYLSHIYFLRRIADTSKLTNLPATSQFNLARSTVPDSAIRELGPTFGAQPQTGWGFTDMMHHVIQSDPTTIPAGDLGTLQENLVKAGYLPPNTVIDGQWGGEFSAALSRFESDNKSKFYSGRHPGSISVMSAVQELGNIMPARVIQGIIGAAKGFVQQTPEVVSRAGALGGAGAGAAIGASLGVLGGPLAPLTVGAGALGGAIVGGIIGFFGDLFTDDKDEKNQNLFSQLVDSLTPYEEYKADPKAFFEDLGWVMTASSMILGVGTGVEAASAGLAGIRTAAAAEGGDLLTATVGRATSAEASTSWMARVSAKLPGMFGKDAEDATLHWIGEHGFRAQLTRPILGDVVQPLFSGVSEAQMGARLFGGLGGGGAGIMDDWSTQFKLKHGRDPTEEEVNRYAAAHAPTTISKAIANAPYLQSGIDIPFMGDLVDLPGWIIYPSHITPWRIGDMGAAVAGRMTGTETYMKPFVNLVSRVTGDNGGAAVARTLDYLGTNDAERYGTVVAATEQFGVQREAEKIVKAKGFAPWEEHYRPALEEAKYAINAKLIAEAGEEHTFKAGEALSRMAKGEKDESMLNTVMSWGLTDPADRMKGPEALEGYLLDLESKGTGISRGPNHLKANEITKGLTEEVRSGTRIPTYTTGKEALPGKVLDTEAYTVRELQHDYDRLAESIKTRTAKVALEEEDTTKAAYEFATLQRDEALLHDMGERIRKLKEYRPATWEERAVIPMKIEEPSTKDFNAWAKEFKQKSEAVQSASLAGDTGAVQRYRAQLKQFVEEHAKYMNPNDIDRITRAERPDTKLVNKISGNFKKLAKTAATDLVYDEETMKRLADLGYKPVLAKANNVFWVPDAHLTEVLGMGDYSRRANLWNSLGMGTDKISNERISALRAGHQKYEVAQMLEKEGKTETAQQVYSRLWSALRGKRSGMAVTNESIRAYQPWAEDMVNEHGLVGIGKRAIAGIAVDIRDLKPTDVYEAVRDWDWSYEDAKALYHAIKRGGALGGEMELLRHPLETAHLLARNFRVSGLPGFTDVMRTWHAEMPGELPKGITAGVKSVHPIPEEVAASTEASRVTKELRETAVSAGLTADETATQERAFHAMLVGTSKATGKPVDEIAASLKVGYAEEYVADGQLALLKRVRENPSHEELNRLVSQYSDTGGFSNYGASRDAIHDVFGGRFVTLGDGRSVAMDDLMTQLIAVTSTGALPSANLTYAEKALTQHLLGQEIQGVGRFGEMQNSVVRDILSGNTIDKWSPELRKAREKWVPFYDALRGNPDALVIDRRIKLIHGLDPNAGITTAERADILEQYQALSAQHDMAIADIQASIWAGFKDHMQERADAAFARGDKTEGEALMKFVNDSAGDSRGYNDLLAMPTKAQKEYLSVINEHVPPLEVLAKRMGDDIRGATVFGPDYEMFMKIFKGGDFSTFVHEQAHVLRRLLPPEEVENLERAYGLHPPLQEVVQGQGQLFSDDSVTRYLTGLNEVERTADLGNGISELSRQGVRDVVGGQLDARTFVYVEDGKAVGTLSVRSGDATLMVHPEYRGRGIATRLVDKAEEAGTGIRAKLGKGKVSDQGAAFTNAYRALGPEKVKPWFDWQKKTVESIPKAVEDRDLGVALENAMDIGREIAFRGPGHAAEYGYVEEKVGSLRRILSRGELRATTTSSDQALVDRIVQGFADYSGPTSPLLDDVRELTEAVAARDESKVGRLLDSIEAKLAGPREGAPAQWTREAEEQFAEDAERYFKTRRMADPSKKRPLEALRNSLGESWSRYRGYTRDQNLIDPAVRNTMESYYGDIFEAAKANHMPNGRWTPAKRALAGAAVGGTLGYIEGDEKVHDAIEGLALGAAGGLAVNALLKRSYGYLPDYLTKVSQALRFSLSPSFDARRFTKGQLLAMMNKEELPFMGVAHRAIERKTWASLYESGATVTGERAWKEALRNMNEINGVGYLEDMDSFERTLTAAGIAGYNPRQREIGYAYMLAQKGRSPTQIKKTLSEVFGYGYGRSAMERSINFVFFPFSFEKKLMTTVGDFLLGAPARAALVTQGMSWYQQSKYDDKIGDFLDRHVPLLENLQNFNAFAHGISPGRFILEGMWDHRTKGGEAAQILSTFFLIPGGAAITPMNQAMGGFGDLSVHAFTPIAVSGQSIMNMGGDLQSGTGVDQIFSMAKDYVPFVTDLNELFTNIHDQAIAATEGEAPWAQMKDYLNEEASFKNGYSSLAALTGHTSVDGFLQSTEGVGAKQEFDLHRQELRDKYPTGFQMTTGFEDSSQLADHAMYQVQKIVASGRGTQAQEVIASLGAQESQSKILASTLPGMDPTVLDQITGQAIRETAMQYADDPKFVELWNQLMAWKYGPITVTVA